MDPKDDTQLPGGANPLSGSNIADEPTQPVEPEAPVPTVGVGIPSSTPKATPQAPTLGQDEPLGETVGKGGTSAGSMPDEPTSPMGGGMGMPSAPTSPAAGGSTGLVNEPDEPVEPETTATTEPEEPTTGDSGTGGVSGL